MLESAKTGQRPVATDEFLAAEAQLDQALHGPVWLRDPRIAEMVVESLRYGQTTLELYSLWAFVVMPNHVHVLWTPHLPLERITRRLKGYTSLHANRLLGRSGHRFWQEESYDHWVRSEEEFSRTVAYIEHNPVRAGMVKRPEDWPWSSACK